MSTDLAPRQVRAGHTTSPNSTSSSAGLSSPPQSPEPESPSITVNHAGAVSNSSVAGAGAGIVFPTATMQFDARPPIKERKKPGRKPKPKDGENQAEASSAPNTTESTKKKRKPRDPNAPPVQRRKKNTATAVLANNPDIKPPLGIQPKFPELAQNPTASETPFSVPPNPNLATRNGNVEAIQKPLNSFFNHTPAPPQSMSQPSSQRTSGQKYDPIRSNYDPVRETIASHNVYSNNHTPVTTQAVNHASASPSISSLVDPPNQPVISPSAQSFLNHQQQQARLSVPPSPTTARLPPSAPAETSGTTIQPPTRPETVTLVPASPPLSKKVSSGPGATAASSRATSPKPSKGSDKEPKDKDKENYPAPPPLPQLGGMGNGASEGLAFRAPTIVLNIPMNGEPNKYINFSRLAEASFGWDALHPRLAAQRDRLARVAAAGAALERNGSGKESGDEMSLDSENEGEGSNADVANTTGNGIDGAKPVKKKRKMKEDHYDKDDNFVDDSDLLWEEQAAAATDGFFVYSGPLIPETEKPADTRADGAPKRGRGSRGPRGGTSRSAARGGPGSRGGRTSGGPGSRGGSTTRKPRITKADRAQMEQEKHDREKMANMTPMPGGYEGMQLAAGPSSLGNAPMVYSQ